MAAGWSCSHLQPAWRTATRGGEQCPAEGKGSLLGAAHRSPSSALKNEFLVVVAALLTLAVPSPSFELPRFMTNSVSSSLSSRRKERVERQGKPSTPCFHGVQLALC